MKITQLIEGNKPQKIPASKPRNFVAKNATGSGAGAHKDKKKAAKQGDVKHKGKEMAELSEGDVVSSIKNIATKVGDALSTALPKDMRPFDYETAAKASAAQKENQEYDDEAGMADNNLETMKRAVQGIDDLINYGDNLPEWCQEKIAVAKSMLVTVWDYMKSEEMAEGYYRRPGRPDAYDRDYQSSISGMGKRDSLAYQLDGGANDEGWDEPRGQYQAPQDKPVLQGYYFYNVPAGKEQEAATYGLKQTKSGKWAKAKYNTSGRSFGMQKDLADKAFGPGRWWSPK